MTQLELFVEPTPLSELLYACEEYLEAERADHAYKIESTFREHMMAKEGLLATVDRINQEGIVNDIGKVL